MSSGSKMDINEVFRGGGRSVEWLDEINKASIVMLAETGLVAKPLAQKIARGVAHIIAEEKKTPPTRSADYLDYEPRLLKVAGPDASRLHTGRSRQDIASAIARMNLRDGLPRGETVTDVDRQLAERLSAVRGPGLGFSRTVAAVYAAVRATPGTELTSLDFQSNGALRIGVGAARESLPTDLKRALEAAGFTVTAGTFQSANGRVTGEMTVTRP